MVYLGRAEGMNVAAVSFPLIARFRQVLKWPVWKSSDRKCPGRYFAMRIIFLNFACILTLLNIEGPPDEKLEGLFSDKSIIRYVASLWFTFTNSPRAIIFGDRDGYD